LFVVTRSEHEPRFLISSPELPLKNETHSQYIDDEGQLYSSTRVSQRYLTVSSLRMTLSSDSPTSPAMQEYLAEAYRLVHYQPDNPYISTSALAGVLRVSAPAVTRMVQRLKDAGYLEHEPYQGVKLTPLGEREALRVIRKHRLVERFLVDVMRFGWHEVHDEADQLGEVISDLIVQRMAQMAGNPRRCPHGEPIPTEDGFMPKLVDTPLTQVEPGEYLVSRVNSHDADKLKYLETLHLRPGARFELVERAPFNGPLHLRVNGTLHHIGHELAGHMRVCQEGEFELQ
jgi:DtxR family Mn-dependent transcriptional regulator